MVGRPQLRISLEIVAISASVWADATNVAACPCKCFDLFINSPTLKETWIDLDRESYERSPRSISSHSRLTLLPRLLSARLMLWLGLGVGGEKSAVYLGPIIVPILTTSLFSKICNWQYCWHILLQKSSMRCIIILNLGRNLVFFRWVVHKFVLRRSQSNWLLDWFESHSASFHLVIEVCCSN